MESVTDKDQIKEWSFVVDDFKPEVGFVFHFDGQHDTRVFHHECKVTEVVKEKKLAYTWKYLGFEGDSHVTFEFIPEGSKTKIRVTHIGLESFPKTNDFLRTNFEQGWSEIIGKLLAEYMAKN